MSSISGVGGSSQGWAQMKSQMQSKMFSKADGNGDGGVDKAELKGMLDELGKTIGKSPEVKSDEMFSKMDGDGNGKLSSTELGKGLESMMQQASSTMDFARTKGGQTSSSGTNPMEALFSKADGNGDNKIDKSELTTLASQIKSKTGMDVSAKLEKLADDNGGSVTKEQFQAAMEKERPSGGPAGMSGPGSAGGAKSASSENKTYDSLDTNQDGTVSEMERLIGELKNASGNQSSKSQDDTGSTGPDVSKLMKQMYEQFSSSFIGGASTNALSAIA
jgi:Ca2+-binding EF-hand superfamily protein